MLMLVIFFAVLWLRVRLATPRWALCETSTNTSSSSHTKNAWAQPRLTQKEILRFSSLRKMVYRPLC